MNIRFFSNALEILLFVYMKKLHEGTLYRTITLLIAYGQVLFS